MKKLFYIQALFFLLLCPVQGQADEEPSVKWNSARPLTWSDFQGPVDPGTDAAAVTASGITYGLSATFTGNRITVDCEIETFFYPQKSWYRKELGDSLVLRHEQLHFDITELHARKMRKAIQSSTFTENVREEVKRIYHKTISELQATQRLYDRETNFSRNPDIQSNWERKIANELNKYSAYHQ
ncbi:DUF922 domain-containing protein [Ascidiimonas aurantiaca]|uniref:DUF922 domain-containing protein n=1 Tax=Ascidiimonas aurantiaca TaxID=1685432 RepID=UPI0030EBBDF1